MSQVQSKTYKCSKEGTPLVQLDFDPQTRIWVLYFLGQQTPDNRLSHAFILDGILPALNDVKAQWEAWVEADDIDMGAALVTTALPQSKIYSNGLDLFNAVSDPRFFQDVLDRMFNAFITFPIPTVASLGGHTFAGGYTLACAHDYRVQNATRGYLCMNEIEFGAPVPDGMMAMLRKVVPDRNILRKVVLEGHRFGAKEAHANGLVDFVADGSGYEGSEGTLKMSIELAAKLRSRAAKNAWGENKVIMHRAEIAVVKQPDRYARAADPTDTSAEASCRRRHIVANRVKLCGGLRVALRAVLVVALLVPAVVRGRGRVLKVAVFTAQPCRHAPRTPRNVQQLARPHLPVARPLAVRAAVERRDHWDHVWHAR